jgi:DNA invertase Pin-like site-specific DNA recombinase
MSTPKSTPTTPQRLIAYVRVSTAAQVANGDSTTAQAEAIHAWALEAGHQVVEIMTDEGLSGTLQAEDRPGLTAALVAIADGGADGLAVLSLDRLARELHVQEAALAAIWSAGGRVFEVVHGEVLQDSPDDPMRRFLRQVMGAASELEAGMVRMGARSGRKRKAAKGGYIGGLRLHRKFGFELARDDAGNWEYVPVPEEQSTIARIVAGRSDGRTLAAIAGELNGEGVNAPNGRCWYPATIKLIAERAVAA